MKNKIIIKIVLQIFITNTAAGINFFIQFDGSNHFLLTPEIDGKIEETEILLETLTFFDFNNRNIWN